MVGVKKKEDRTEVLSPEKWSFFLLEVTVQQTLQALAVASLAGYLLISEATASINAFALPKSANL